MDFYQQKITFLGNIFKVFVDAEENLPVETPEGTGKTVKLVSSESTTGTPTRQSILIDKQTENGDVSSNKSSSSRSGNSSKEHRPREVSFQPETPVFYDASPKQEDDEDSDMSSDESPATTRGGTYPNEILESFGLNIHRIDKDVKRCDRNHWYFTEKNLDKLRNVMCT